MLQAFLKDDSGASTLEYGFIVALVSIAILATLVSLGDSVDLAYAQVNDEMAVAAGMPAAGAPGDALALDGAAIAAE